MTRRRRIFARDDIQMSSFDAFLPVIDEYMPDRGEGDTLASQAVTAVNKLIYKWYNDGDVYDNTYYLNYYGNDLSSYANWLYKNIPESKNILIGIRTCKDDTSYEILLYELASRILDEEFVEQLADTKSTGSIYNCDGVFSFEYPEDDEYDDYYDDDDEYEDDDY